MRVGFTNTVTVAYACGSRNSGPIGKKNDLSNVRMLGLGVDTVSFDSEYRCCSVKSRLELREDWEGGTCRILSDIKTRSWERQMHLAHS